MRMPGAACLAAAWIEAVRLATLSYSMFCIVAVTLADGPAWHLMLWYLTLITINLGHAAYLLYERTRSEEHTSELQSLMRISYAVFCLKKKKKYTNKYTHVHKQIVSSQP